MTLSTKVRDILIVIVAPFVVPGVVLAFSRLNTAPSWPDAFNLTDIAFGFVAVAMAGTARAATAKTDAWMAFSMAALIEVALQTTFAISVDNVNQTAALTHRMLATKAPDSTSYDELIRLAQGIVDSEPTGVQWALSLVVGFALTAISFELIRRER